MAKGFSHNTVPACADRLMHQSCVRGWWRGDGDDVNRSVIESFAEGRTGARHAQELRAGLRFCRIAPDQRPHFDAGIAQGTQVREHTKAGSDHYRTQRRFACTHGGILNPWPRLPASPIRGSMACAHAP